MSKSSLDARFLARPRPNPSASMRLFCFPYAGGGAHIYHPWLPSLPPTVEFCAISLPGRGTRIREAPHRECNSLVQAILDDIHPYLDKPFAFFGHSMGAIVSFELSRRLRAEGHPLPEHLFISGCHAPHLPDPHPIHHLPGEEFLAELSAMGGIPQEILDSKELMELILPGIHADFSLVENYSYKEELPLACPIFAFGGLQDDLVEPKHLEAWSGHTTAHFETKFFPGNHFFLHSSQQPLLDIIVQRLK